MKNYREDYLLDIIRKIAKNSLLSEKFLIHIGKGSEKLDGFMGEILTISVENEETGKLLNLVAKISLKDERIRDYTAIAQSYRNEIAAYQHFFPAINEMRKQMKIKNPIGWLVKVYYASETEDEEYIIMENIKQDGFEMLPVKQLLDEEEVSLIFKSYAELHASSMALKELHPKKFQDITSNNVSVFRTLLDMKISKDIVYSMKSIWDVMEEKNIKHPLLDQYMKDTIGILKRKMDFSNEKYVSFLHGDGWSNNMMFKYEMEYGQRILKDIKLLDWQAWTIGPPVIDLLFCLFSSCSEQVFSNFEAHIESYYKHFTDTLALYNLKADDIYPRKVMQEQLDVHYHFPAIFGIMIRKIRSFDENHTIDPVNFEPKDDDSTFFDAVRDVDFDKEYLLKNLKYILAFLDNKTIKNYGI